jgi:HAD superfamily hydrolase (TIGR01662 family)
MIQAYLFDFHQTLIQSPAWLALEVRTLPRAAFSLMARHKIVPLLDKPQLAKAEDVFRTSRHAAETTGHETSHVEDLTTMVAALELQQLVSHQAIEETIATLHRRCVETATMIDGAAQTLQDLRASSYRLGIISNAAYSPFLTWTLDHFKLLHFFELVVVSADVGTRKPWSQIFHIALERMGLPPSQVAYVGDDYIKDVVASKRVGMRAIWFQPDGNPAPSNQEKSPDASVSSLDQIPTQAERWREKEAGVGA